MKLSYKTLKYLSQLSPVHQSIKIKRSIQLKITYRKSLLNFY